MVTSTLRAEDLPGVRLRAVIDCAWPCESTHWWPAKVPTLDRLT